MSSGICSVSNPSTWSSVPLLEKNMMAGCCGLLIRQCLHKSLLLTTLLKLYPVPRSPGGVVKHSLPSQIYSLYYDPPVHKYCCISRVLSLGFFAPLVLPMSLSVPFRSSVNIITIWVKVTDRMEYRSRFNPTKSGYSPMSVGCSGVSTS